MSYPTSIEQLKEWIEGPLEVREAPAAREFTVEKDGTRLSLSYMEFTESGPAIEGWGVGQLFFSKQDALTSFWYQFQRQSLVQKCWHHNGMPQGNAKVIYWRIKPEADCQNGIWHIYARFCITDCDWPLAADEAAA